MSQRKIHSLLEQVVDKAFGFLSSLLIWSFALVPIMGYNSDWHKNIWVTVIFTMWSIIRGYGTRRFFNWLHNKGFLR